MTDGKLRLYCERGWSYDGPNEFEARMNGARVSGAFAAFVNAYHSGPGYEDAPPVVYGGGRYCTLDGSEGFTLEDLAAAAAEVFAVEVVAHDGEGYR